MSIQADIANWFSTFFKEWFDFLVDWFTDIWSHAWDNLTTAWTYSKAWSLKLWTFVVGIGALIALVLTKATELVAQGTAALDDLAHNASPGSPPEMFTTVGELMNTFFPFNELIVFMLAYLGIWLSTSLYRLVKSWIPTMAT